MIDNLTLTKELAEVLLQVEPEHGRTSCSDERLYNGYMSSSGDWPRCNRCLLLEVIRDELPEGAAHIKYLELGYVRREEL